MIRSRAVAALAALALAGACASDDDAPGAAPTTTTASSTTTTEPRYREPVVDDVTVTADIEYGSAPGVGGGPESLRLDLYTPDDDGSDARPAVVFVHGGGYAVGDKGAGPSAEMARHFAELGYVTASIDYRLLAPQGCSAGGGQATDACQLAAIEAIHDAQAAVRWLRLHADEHRIDGSRLAIAGESAGAITATGVGVWSDSPGTSGSPGPPSSVAAWMSLSGGVPGGIFVSPGDAPGILFAGTADPVVPHSWSVETRDALVAADVPVELVSYDGLGHVPWGERRDDIIERTVEFFHEHLRLAEL